MVSYLVFIAFRALPEGIPRLHLRTSNLPLHGTYRYLLLKNKKWQPVHFYFLDSCVEKIVHSDLSSFQFNLVHSVYWIFIKCPGTEDIAANQEKKSLPGFVKDIRHNQVELSHFIDKLRPKKLLEITQLLTRFRSQKCQEVKETWFLFQVDGERDKLTYQIIFIKYFNSCRNRIS